MCIKMDSGCEYEDLNANETKFVLCLIHMHISTLNNIHKCIIYLLRVARSERYTEYSLFNQQYFFPFNLVRGIKYVLGNLFGCLNHKCRPRLT